MNKQTGRNFKTTKHGQLISSNKQRQQLISRSNKTGTQLISEAANRTRKPNFKQQTGQLISRSNKRNQTISSNKLDETNFKQKQGSNCKRSRQ
jgi:hypothetical protein